MAPEMAGARFWTWLVQAKLYNPATDHMGRWRVVGLQVAFKEPYARFPGTCGVGTRAGEFKTRKGQLRRRHPFELPHATCLILPIRLQGFRLGVDCWSPQKLFARQLVYSFWWLRLLP